MKKAKFWEKTDSGQIKCTLCPRYCLLKSGQAGYCFVRMNKDNILYSLAWAHPVAIHADPIEKKPLYHFLPGTKTFSLGTAGCNLGCKFCQNWQLSHNKQIQESAQYLSPEEIVQLAIKYQCNSISYTYNEPTIFAEYVMDTAQLAKESGLKNIMVTNGYITAEALPEVYKHIDAANVDLKGFSEEFYKKYTASSLQPVLETIRSLKKMGKWVEITNLVIPTLNDSDSMLKELVTWIAHHIETDVPVHFSAFHPDYQIQDIPPTPIKTLIRAKNLAEKAGLTYIYIGNIADRQYSTTYCSKCHSELIERNWYNTSVTGMEHDKCKQCGATIPGVFS
ncbi:MAG: AmmeMemoRadiSam system radical SAM enzyme [Calditrichia bacterium]